MTDVVAPTLKDHITNFQNEKRNFNFKGKRDGDTTRTHMNSTLTFYTHLIYVSRFCTSVYAYFNSCVW